MGPLPSKQVKEDLRATKDDGADVQPLSCDEQEIDGQSYRTPVVADLQGGCGKDKNISYSVEQELHRGNWESDSDAIGFEKSTWSYFISQRCAFEFSLGFFVKRDKI